MDEEGENELCSIPKPSISWKMQGIASICTVYHSFTEKIVVEAPKDGSILSGTFLKILS